MEPAPAIALPRPGDVIDGRYTVVRVIGEGGMGVVFEATYEKLRQRVAIKVLQPEIAQSREVVARFEREARAAGQLRGRHVARVTDVEVSPGKLPYMVMEFLEGHDLATELDERGGLPLAEAVGYLLQACKGIAEAHDAGIIHRDLKPSNLFLCDELETGGRVVKLLDFGISKRVDDASNLTSTMLAVGTLFYMSPEQVRSAKSVDTRTDIWALGVILYELLAGTPPFIGSAPSVAAAIVTDEPVPLSSYRGDVPPELEDVLRKALAKKPADRFADVQTFAAAIAPFGPALASADRVLVAPVVRSSSGSLPRIASDLANAETLIGEPARAATGPGTDSARLVPAPLAVATIAAGATAPGWTAATLAAPPSRRKPLFALAGAAVLAVAVVGLATRAARSHVSAPPAEPPAATMLAPEPPIPVPGMPASTPVMAPSPERSATPPVASTSARPKAPPKAPASEHAPVATPPPQPATSPKKRDEKPPLVAPF